MSNLPHSVPEVIISTTSESVFDSVSIDIAHLLIKKFSLAMTSKDWELKSMLSCQVFDLLDWARRKIPIGIYDKVEQRVLLGVETPPFRFKTMELFEEYIEEVLINGNEEVLIQ